MIRGAEPTEPTELSPHPLGAKGRVAALRVTGAASSAAARDEAPEYDAARRQGMRGLSGARPDGDEPGDAGRERAAVLEGEGAADAAPAAVPDGGTAAQPAGHDPGPVPAGWVPDRRPTRAGPGRAWAARLATAGPWGDLAEKWVPESLRGARVDPKRRGALLLAAVAAIASVAAALGVWWSRPQPTPVLSGASATSPAGAVESLGTEREDGGGPGEGASIDAAGPDVGRAGSDPSRAGQATEPVAPPGSPPSGPSGTIVVSVTGDVRRPGVVTVPADARVADAIDAAGGALDDSDLTGLNLAAHLTDGSSVVVAGGGRSTFGPDSADPTTSGGDPSAGVGGTPDAKISLNTADATALQTLSGVGPVTAEAIIAYRTEHGRFTDLAQLQEVSGIGPATFARLEPHVTL